MLGARPCGEFFLEGCEQQRQGATSLAGVCLCQGEPLQSAGPSPMATGNILFSQELGPTPCDQNVYNNFKLILNLSSGQYEKTSLSLGDVYKLTN